VTSDPRRHRAFGDALANYPKVRSAYSLVAVRAFDLILSANRSRSLEELAAFLTCNLAALEKLHSYIRCTEINTVAFDHSEVFVRNRYGRLSFAQSKGNVL
jgi:hypothetical protein